MVMSPAHLVLLILISLGSPSVESCGKCGLPLTEEEQKKHIYDCDGDSQYDHVSRSELRMFNNMTLWSKCDYPNPQTNWEECGRPQKSWLCDPDGVLNKDEADALETMLMESFKDTHCRCKEKCSESYTGHPIMVLIVKHMRIPDLSEKYCIGGSCEEIYPQFNPHDRQATENELQRGIVFFADELRESWQSGRCQDDIVIVYMSQHKQLAVSAGKLVKETIDQILDSAQIDALIGLESNEPGMALRGLVAEYSQALEKSNTHLIIGITITVVISLLAIFGVIMTVVFCRKEFAQGKTCYQVCNSCAGGENAILFGGNKHHMVPPVYEKTNTSDTAEA